MAITNMDQLVAGLPAMSSPMLKAAFAPQATGAWTSLWASPGNPGAGANATSGVGGNIPTSTTPGSFDFTNPVSPALSYLARFSAYGTVAGQLLLYDRLWHNSGLSPTLLTAQTVNSVALDRPDSLGADVEAWFQVYGVLGAGAVAPTISYTDQNGVAGNTGTLQTFVGASAAQRTYPFALAAGDTGVRSIQTYTNVASLASGTFGLILRRYVTMVHIAAASFGQTLDPIQGGLPRIYDNACLELIWQASTTTAVTIGGALAIAQG